VLTALLRPDKRHVQAWPTTAAFELGLLVGCGDCAEADRWEVTLDRSSVRQEGPARHTSVHWATHCETGA